MTIRTFAYGGGVQSTAALVLAAQGAIDFPVFLFANVGHDSEYPATLAYVQNVARPFAAASGIELVEVAKTYQGRQETLLGMIKRRPRSVPIPVRMPNGAPASRTCTADFKIDVMAKWQKAAGATATDPAVMGLGISIDEWHRAKSDSGIAWQVLSYPLIDLRMSRLDCEKMIAGAGLPIPPKSACWFCPFHSRNEWIRIKRDEPALFAQALDLEQLMNDRRAAQGKDPVYFHASAYPLDRAVGDQLPLFDDSMAVCESGYCMI